MNKLIILALSIISWNAKGQTSIFLEEFETGIPTSWTQLNLDMNGMNAIHLDFSSGWISRTDNLDLTNKTAASSSFFEPVGAADRWLISPEVTLGTFGNILSFKAHSHDPSYLDDYLVLISTDGNNQENFQDTLLIVKGENEFWETRSVNLSDSGYNAQPIHLAFVHNSSDKFILYLDSISIIKDDPSGIDAAAIEPLKMYPNPANSAIYFEKEILNLHVFNLLGELMIQAENCTNLKIENLVSGIYLIEGMSLDGVRFKSRFVKN